MSRRPMRFARQALLLQIGLIALVVGIGFVLVASLLDRALVDQFGQRALAVAHAAAADTDLAAAVARDDRSGTVQERAEQIRVNTGALFIVIADRRGIRLAHPDPSKIGEPVSTDPSEVLAGNDVVDVQRGTLGFSARGKVPLRDRTGTVVGQVSVGFDTEDIDHALLRLLGTTAVFTGGALVVGVIGAALLTRGLKRRTLGLEPHELADLVREREAVLYGIGEGVLAVDADGRVSFANQEAEQLLGTGVTPGTPVRELEVPSRLRSALESGQPVQNLITVAGDRVLVANHRRVSRDGADLGSVLTLRDRTDLEVLSRELESVRGMTDVLRAQRHEFSNRLHTLSGLLQTGHQEDAVAYLQALTSGPVTGLGPAADAVRDPVLLAFLAAKKAVAAEKSVVLELGETSWVPGRVRAPVEVTTVVGNLVDNAVTAAQLGERRPARVEVDLLADGATLHVSVVDSGRGVPPELREDLFVEGVSTKDGDHGLGLALCRQAARSFGGDVRLADPGDPAERGAVFHAWLPGAVAETEEGA
ncbi:two-component system, CitB family, sensor kinase [Saccharopolyspora antimicrobica]|uniref:histidine kinase n=1 Tax=Saccharopolyspora antimicrobica TaxID=455193 RepID=A0A1I5H3N7_9PSEU|nr:sensor histidine kinase [Saccharopolyspora antimicrobica]RKT90111.1 two-component system CitB family sensor kinase [Saccharopolyspora antimicrobica]SFO42646.1 two-component system, CitB family, sensor kinase [Saccharopolyspora antimicrobica]